ncbi:TPA: methyl-coenzyme M reductase [Acinetobacter baumannii]|uniref:Methyl-coenzyme M reductase n=1 Tax=Acinetobacter baumannii TaxID=470 RepID=A0A6B2Q884_ACIBA|nr:methyl-coenzyme M reductase [Acinetobacter baumannii]MBD0176384.1 methyl-coenzyme M reductase [Acinetobacter baumannii]MBF8415034.1 methyl-coenzyme M reductase [Acinetobacter baumannii]MDC4025003.1 methyl-coenzyme M reductase [Acinetobacter baumannii]MDN8346762.1 methyl-coenzyme M reductase [Acinetobacter baumannii]MDN8348885.1 methyl-coenzyme M reductase [Acinetobacter baumannii]
MRIPISRGREAPQAQMQSFTPNTGLAEIGRSIGGAIQARDDQQRQQEVTAKNLELYNNQLAEKEGKLKLDESLSTDFNDKVVDIKNRLGNGVITTQQADEELNTWSNAKFSELQNSLPGHAQEDLKKYWDSNVTRQRTSFLPLQLRADEQKGGVLADRFFDVATRMDREAGKEYLLKNIVGLPLSEAQKSELTNKYETTRDITDINSRITTAIAQNSVEGLQEVATGLKDYKFIDGSAVQKFQTEIQSKITTLQQRQQVQENKRINEAEKVVNEFIQSTLTGRPLDLKYQNDVEQAVKGTPSEAEYQFYKKQSADFMRFQGLTTDQQLAEINSRKAKMKNSSSADPVAENKILATYQSIYDNKLKTAKENPTQALREKGIELPEVNPLTLKVNPSDFAKNIVTIGSYQVAQRDKDPNATIKPIPNEALPAAKQAWEEATVDQKLNLISSMIAQTKGVKDGVKIWGAALGQLDGGNSNYVMAGVAKANGYRSTEGRELANSIVIGTQLLKNKQLIMPKEDDMREAFNKYVGQTLTGTNANNAYEVFKAVYADTMNERGFSHSSKDEAPNKKILNTALGMATGGVYTQPTSFRNYRGDKVSDWKVTKPYGITDDAFEAQLEKGYQTISKQTGISVNNLKEFRLRQGKPSSTGAIQYDLINERGQQLVVKNAIWRITMDGVNK